MWKKTQINEIDSNAISWDTGKGVEFEFRQRRHSKHSFNIVVLVCDVLSVRSTVSDFLATNYGHDLLVPWHNPGNFSFSMPVELIGGRISEFVAPGKSSILEKLMHGSSDSFEECIASCGPEAILEYIADPGNRYWLYAARLQGFVAFAILSKTLGRERLVETILSDENLKKMILRDIDRLIGVSDIGELRRQLDKYCVRSDFYELNRV